MTTPSLPRINKHADRIGRITAEAAGIGGVPHGDYEFLASLAGTVGGAALATEPHQALERWGRLATVASTAILWVGDHFNAEPEDVQRQIVDEYVRADREHNGNTPYNPQMSDEHRLAILMEEVGEVARCLTPDANTGIGHAGDLEEELIQTAAMAFAWAMRIVDDMEGYSE